MAQARRKPDPLPAQPEAGPGPVQAAPAPVPSDALPGLAPPAGWQPGGPVGQLHADLQRRLGEAWAPLPPSPAERLVRRLSVTGGWAALAAGYGAAAVLLLR